MASFQKPSFDNTDYAMVCSEARGGTERMESDGEMGERWGATGGRASAKGRATRLKRR
jgi:hypothetical protein